MPGPLRPMAPAAACRGPVQRQQLQWQARPLRLTAPASAAQCQKLLRQTRPRQRTQLPVGTTIWGERPGLQPVAPAAASQSPAQQQRLAMPLLCTATSLKTAAMRGERLGLQPI